jgi:ribosome-binding factor A
VRADIFPFLKANMQSNKRLREILLEQCAEVSDDDGQNPRDERKDGGDGRKESRKARQLCRQVAETLDWVFSGDSPDDLLRSLHVASVEPAPHSSRLLVTVVADIPAERAAPQLILERLQQHVGRLRREVAASINRRKVPTLVFQVVSTAAPDNEAPA